MKLKVIHIFSFAALLFCIDAAAQVDRRIAPQQYRRPKHEVKSFVDATLEFYTKELKLDDFQKAAIKNILQKEEENINALRSDTEMIRRERADKAEEITDRIYDQIIPLLNEEQAKKLTEIKNKKKK